MTPNTPSLTSSTTKEAFKLLAIAALLTSGLLPRTVPVLAQTLSNTAGGTIMTNTTTSAEFTASDASTSLLIENRSNQVMTRMVGIKPQTHSTATDNTNRFNLTPKELALDDHPQSNASLRK